MDLDIWHDVRKNFRSSSGIFYAADLKLSVLRSVRSIE